MYDAYGKKTKFPVVAEPTRETFTGKEYDEEGAVSGITDGIELYYFGAR